MSKLLKKKYCCVKNRGKNRTNISFESGKNNLEDKKKGRSQKNIIMKLWGKSWRECGRSWTSFCVIKRCFLGGGVGGKFEFLNKKVNKKINIGIRSRFSEKGRRRRHLGESWGFQKATGRGTLIRVEKKEFSMKKNWDMMWLWRDVWRHWEMEYVFGLETKIRFTWLARVMSLHQGQGLVTLANGFLMLAELLFFLEDKCTAGTRPSNIFLNSRQTGSLIFRQGLS